MTKSLDEFRQDIAEERRGGQLRGTYSHNIVAFSLRSISKHYGVAEANKAIRQYGLNKLGWVEQAGEEPPVTPIVDDTTDPLDRVMREP